MRCDLTSDLFAVQTVTPHVQLVQKLVIYGGFTAATSPSY